MAPTSSLPLMVTSSEVVDGLNRASLLHAGGLPYSFDAFFLQGHTDTAAAPPAIEPPGPGAPPPSAAAALGCDVV